MSVQTNERELDTIFSSTPYYIDFYQREYKWQTTHVEDLLDDIFIRFEKDYDSNIEPDDKGVNKQHEWYYMSTILTNKYDGKTYIVDGQQRLTTLTLVLIKLYKMAKEYESFLERVIENKICGHSTSGHIFWMGQNGREEVLKKLMFDTEEVIGDSITEKNMVNNYIKISEYLEHKISDSHKFNCFVRYLLHKIIFVEIHIIEHTDVPMVFEVINNRGEKLRPYEVLKGEILGRLDRDEVEDKYLWIWNNAIEPLENIGSDEPDNFFRYYLRGKYANKEAEHTELEGDYHKILFSRNWNQKVSLKENPHTIRQFVNSDVNYFGKMYYDLNSEDIYDRHYGEYVFYNYLNELNRQYMLIFSACSVDDDEKEEKVHLVSRLLDRHFVILQLYGCYDSNSFTEILIDLNSRIRENPCEEIQEIFDNRLLNDINEKKGVENSTIFDYRFFRDAGINLAIRFKRYFFARIENYIASGMDPTSKLTKQQYWNLVRNTGSKHGYHVEHILGNSDENRKIFNDDEEEFQRERNRLGGLLLLKGKNNIPSGNEPYIQKLKTYNNSDISNRWNRSLCSSFYHNNKDFTDFIKDKSLPFKPYDTFDKNAIEERQKLLFEMVKQIWA